MKKITTLTFILLSFFAFSQQKTIDQKVDALLKRMTLEEKIGQLNQYTGDNAATGPVTINPNKQSEIKAGLIGSYVECFGNATHETIPRIGDAIEIENSFVVWTGCYSWI